MTFVPAILAMLVASAVAVVAFVPFVAVSYRRRGTLTFWHVAGSLAALTYALGLLAYVLVPFPDSRDFRCVPPQLNPLQAVTDIAEVPGSPPLYANPAFLQLVLNIVLFLPFGFLLRGMFGRGVRAAVVGGLLVSLTIELTQLTGIWGLYPCAYRVFDVDDLITNTIGAVLGSLAAIPVLRGRPREDSPDTPRPVTRKRRLLGMLVDLLSFTVGAAIVSVGTASIDLAFGGDGGDEPFTTIGQMSALLLHVIVVYATGSTLGERIVLIGVDERRRPLWLSRTVRLALGIGGYGLLSTAGGLFPLLATLLGITAVASVLFGRSRRGLAAAAAGQSIRDLRSPRSRLDDARVRDAS